MKLVASYHKNSRPLRQLLRDGNRLFRRIEDGPQWQEQIHNGDFHNITDSNLVLVLEFEYQESHKEKATSLVTDHCV